MVLVSLDEPAEGMTRSTSFTGTVNIAYALGDKADGEKRKPSWRDLLLPGAYGALAGLAMSVRKPRGAASGGLSRPPVASGSPILAQKSMGRSSTRAEAGRSVPFQVGRQKSMGRPR